MSETKALFGLLMLALIFNSLMYGVFSFVSEAGLDTIDCELGQFGTNNTAEFSGTSTPTSLNNCEPEGLPLWYYAFWIIINGGIAFAFIPFK